LCFPRRRGVRAVVSCALCTALCLHTKIIIILIIIIIIIIKIIIIIIIIIIHYTAVTAQQTIRIVLPLSVAMASRRRYIRYIPTGLPTRGREINIFNDKYNNARRPRRTFSRAYGLFGNYQGSELKYYIVKK